LFETYGKLYLYQLHQESGLENELEGDSVRRETSKHLIEEDDCQSPRNVEAKSI
jgi:hypothetical protein